jgi:hypothetical protein
MSELEWTSGGIVSWLDTDQFDVVKLSSIVRLVWSGYGEFVMLATGRTRTDFFSDDAWSPVTQYLEVAATGLPAYVDNQTVLRYRSSLGFMAGPSERYGVVDSVDVELANGDALATCRHHWMWFHRQRAVIAIEPVPGVIVDQDTELPRPPRRPETSDAEPLSTFRWTVRESDINRHVNVGAYVERAENAAADAEVDTAALRRAAMWFRRPAFSGDRMEARVLHDDSSVVVDLVDAASQESCCVLKLSA